MIPDLFRYEEGIELNEEVVLMTTKGEALALGTALMTTAVKGTVETLFYYDHLELFVANSVKTPLDNVITGVVAKLST